MSRSALKYWAITAMLIDHIAWLWFPSSQLPGQLMHVLGRTTAPIMCFFIAEGYAHTRDVPRYFARLIVFAVVAHSPFIWFECAASGWVDWRQIVKAQTTLQMTSVIWTLSCGLLAVWAWDKLRYRILKVIAVAALCILATPGDWMFLGVLMCLMFHMFRGSKRKTAVALAVMSVVSFAEMWYLSGGGFLQFARYNWFQLAITAAIPLILSYNGKRGRFGGKWLFYAFYPLHLIALVAVKLWVWR